MNEKVSNTDDMMFRKIINVFFDNLMRYPFNDNKTVLTTFII